MNSLKIEVAQKTYPIKFGYGATFLLGQKWELSGVLPVYQKALSILGLDKQKAKTADVDKMDFSLVAESMLEFKNVEILADVIHAGILLENKSAEVVIEDIYNAILEDISMASQVMMAFINTMPRPKENVIPAKTTGKPKPQKAVKKKKKKA